MVTSSCYLHEHETSNTSHHECMSSILHYKEQFLLIFMFFRSFPRISLARALSTSTAVMLPSTNRSSSNPPVISLSQITPYFPRHAAWPYSSRDFTRSDEASDSDFYTQPRFVAHIDDPAISRLTAYYGTVIPRTGRVLDFCTAWNSWYPDVITDAVNRGDVEVYGLGMNAKELAKNQLLCGFSDRSAAVDLNVAPHSISAGWSSNHGDGQTVPKFDCATCTVSIDYLTEPVKVLESVRKHMSDGGTVHLIISNRCFPTKAVRIWLELDTNERLQLVGGMMCTGMSYPSY